MTYTNPTIYINITSKDIKGVSPKGSENWFVDKFPKGYWSRLG